mgnify:FL=1
MTDVASLAGSTPLARLLGGYMPPRKRFTLDVLRCDAAGAPVTITLRLAVRAISVEETEEAHAEAVKYLTTKGGHTREDFITSQGDSIMEVELMTQVLARALMDHDDLRAPFAKDAAALRGALFTDEIEACFREYSAWQAERSPIRALRSADELREVVDALGKGRVERTSLLRFDVISLTDIALSLADRVQKQTRPSSSDTSPPSESPETSSTGSEIRVEIPGQ